jgi:hypothetical protein
MSKRKLGILVIAVMIVGAIVPALIHTEPSQRLRSAAVRLLRDLGVPGLTLIGIVNSN